MCRDRIAEFGVTARARVAKRFGLSRPCYYLASGISQQIKNTGQTTHFYDGGVFLGAALLILFDLAAAIYLIYRFWRPI